MSVIGTLLSRAHEAGRDFVPPAPARWRSWFGRDLPGHLPGIGHCDTGPWNVVAGSAGPYAFIDWEFAGPVDASWELAQAAWLNAQLHDDDLAERLNLPPAATRARQVRLLLDGYGLSTANRVGFVEKLIEIAVRAAQAEAIQHAVTEDSTEALTADGYPVLWAITWRARSAAWVLKNRTILERAIS